MASAAVLSARSPTCALRPTDNEAARRKPGQ
jgi:hypothetical protein